MKKFMTALIAGAMALSAMSFSALAADETGSFSAYVSSQYTDRIWGETVNATADESLVIKIYSEEGEHMATTSLKAETDLIDGDVSVTWNARTNGEESSSWDTSWETGHPVDNVPAKKAELWVDGVLVDTATIGYAGPDDLKPYEWANLEGVAISPKGTFNGGMVNIENPNATFISTEISNLYAKESIVLKIYDEEGTLLATTTAAEQTVALGASTLSVVTCISGTDDWWTTEWEKGKLRADYIPAYGVLYVDGNEMNQAQIQMIKTKGETPIVWGEVIGVLPAPNANIQGPYILGVDSKGRETIKVDIYEISAYDNFTVKLFDGETLLSETVLRKTDRDDESNELYPLTGVTTVNIVLGDKTAGSWDTVWYTKPNVSNIPNKIEAWADGELVDTWEGTMRDEYIANYKAYENVGKVAKIGEEVYGTLQAAVDAAVDGDTITLVSDVVLGAAVNVDKAITLDLNGYTVAPVDNWSDDDSMIIVNYGGDLTINDSVGTGTVDVTSLNGKVYSSIKMTKKGEVYVDAPAKLTINGGTFVGYYYGIVGNGGRDNTEITINGGTVKGIAAIYHPQDGDLTITGGTLEGSVGVYFCAGNLNISDDANIVANGEKEEYKETVSGFDITGDALVIDNRNTGDNGYGPVTATITGGTFTSANADAVGSYAYAAAGDALTGFISGGTFSSDVSAYLAEGYDLTAFAGEYIVHKAVANGIAVKFVKNDASTTDEIVYDIVLATTDGVDINRLNSADLTFVNNSAEGVVYSVLASEKNADVTVNPAVDNDGEVIADRYEFHYTGKDNVTTDTAASIVIGKVVFTGIGAVNFGVADAATNVVYATTAINNLVTDFIPEGGTTTNVNKGTLDTSATIAGETLAEPTATLTINVSFPNNVEANAYAYQNMEVTIEGAEVDYKETIELGDDAELVDNKYTVTKALQANTPYQVTVTGDGYRTARYTVVLTEDKTLNFWNNLMDADKQINVEESASGSKNPQRSTFLAGDIVKDNDINLYDLSAVVSYFGKTGMTASDADYIQYDLNRDGDIDSKDIAMVLVSWED